MPPCKKEASSNGSTLGQCALRKSFVGTERGPYTTTLTVSIPHTDRRSMVDFLFVFHEAKQQLQPSHWKFFRAFNPPTVLFLQHSTVFVFFSLYAVSLLDPGFTVLV